MTEHCDECRFVKDCSLHYFPPCEQLARRDEQHYRKIAEKAERMLEELAVWHKESIEKLNHPLNGAVSPMAIRSAKIQHERSLKKIETLRGDSTPILDEVLLTEIIGTLTLTEGFVPTAIRSEVMRLRERLAERLREWYRQ